MHRWYFLSVMWYLSLTLTYFTWGREGMSVTWLYCGVVWLGVGFVAWVRFLGWFDMVTAITMVTAIAMVTIAAVLLHSPKLVTPPDFHLETFVNLVLYHWGTCYHNIIFKTEIRRSSNVSYGEQFSKTVYHLLYHFLWWYWCCKIYGYRNGWGYASEIFDIYKPKLRAKKVSCNCKVV